MKLSQFGSLPSTVRECGTFRKHLKTDRTDCFSNTTSDPEVPELLPPRLRLANSHTGVVDISSMYLLTIVMLQ